MRKIKKAANHYLFNKAFKALDDYKKYYQFFLMGEVSECEVRMMYKRYIMMLVRAERRLGE